VHLDAAENAATGCKRLNITTAGGIAALRLARFFFFFYYCLRATKRKRAGELSTAYLPAGVVDLDLCGTASARTPVELHGMQCPGCTDEMESSWTRPVLVTLC
jgi:hypothetical protein